LQEGFNDFVGTISNLHEAILRNRGKRMPDLLSDLGVAYMDIGFPEVGKQYWQKALELDEDSARYLYWFIPAEYFKGNFENAYQLAKSLNKRDSVRAKIVMPSICIMTGRGKEAYYYFEHIAERLKKSGEIDLVASQAIGYSYWKAGKTNEAEYYFNQQIKISLECIRLGRWNTINRLAHFNLAKVYAFKGDKEKAYRYLDEVNKNQSFDLWWVTEFKYSPFLNSIRQEPRFQKILKNVEAKYQAEHERVRKWLVSQGML
jgi:tetratricopeptide (TPR) repeat protein